MAQCGCKEQRWPRWTSSDTWGQLCRVMETVGVSVERGRRQGGVDREKRREWPATEGYPRK